jgi:hypothetical protein
MQRTLRKRGIPASKKLGQIDLKRQNSPPDGKLNYRFRGADFAKKAAD